MTNDIIILDEMKTTWTETRKVQVTRWEDQEVECTQRFIDLRLPLADLQLLSALGERQSSTADMKEVGERLRSILRDMGISSARHRCWCEK